MFLRIVSARAGHCQGPNLAEGIKVSQNVSLVDVMPTLLDLAETPIPNGLRGRSLLPSLRGDTVPEDVVVAEYHAQGMLSAGYMAKKGNFKYNYYVDLPAQLFDLAADPNELTDLAGQPGWSTVETDLHQELLARLDPEGVDQRAKSNQQLQGIARSYAV